ncbi:MAG: RNA polymerase subunit sigma-70 [Bacteroidetes bacterium CG12_big_fil_rev_8_21_14_0_65_60_17]|nr:MAG: RNA polymerase subunit sigma-70 [Bacteroidetes bacterium CG12_big_fil_rev_8_21_14_0_65_60_17]
MPGPDAQRPDHANVTMLLNALGTGNRRALDELFPVVYNELRERARQERRRLGGHATMNTTALVHEAYVKLVGADGTGPGGNWASRAHFYAVAAKAMRHIFLDYAKRKTALKRGGNIEPVSLVDATHTDPSTALPDMTLEAAQELLRLQRALDRLASQNERQARVVECRFFGGMSIEDTAAALGTSPATVKRDWTNAQIALWRLLS